MNVEEFRKIGKAIIDLICLYYTNSEDNDTIETTKVQPGYLKNLIPENPPQNGENFNMILQDFVTKILPGIYQKHENSTEYIFLTILGDLLSSALGTIGFSWSSCPASTELELIMLNWYAKLLNLPKAFLGQNIESTTAAATTTGGGVLQSSTSESILVCMLTARSEAIKRLKGFSKETHDSIYVPQLTAYASKKADESVARAARISLIKLRTIETDRKGRMRVDLLRIAIQNDIQAGLTPFFVIANATSVTIFDDFTAIGQVCKSFQHIWFHIDGCNAANLFILPEMRPSCTQSLEYADSFNVSPNKLLGSHTACSAMWVRNMDALKNALHVNPIYLQHNNDNVIDFRHFGIPLSHRFKALEFWFLFRTLGVKKIQKLIRNNIVVEKSKVEKKIFEDWSHTNLAVDMCVNKPQHKLQLKRKNSSDDIIIYQFL